MIQKLRKKIIKDNIFKYSIKIADFYYKDSAETMINRINNETSITDPTIKKLSKQNIGYY